MSTLDPEQWEALSPYLDRALALSGDDRANWLASVRSEDPVLASQLQTLLDEHQLLAEERFLERAPVALGDHIALAGRAVGSYTLRKPIGQGGMATVWLAERNDGHEERCHEDHHALGRRDEAVGRRPYDPQYQAVPGGQLRAREILLPVRPFARYRHRRLRHGPDERNVHRRQAEQRIEDLFQGLGQGAAGLTCRRSG